MPDTTLRGEIVKALRERTFPTITLWNRLEARPRTENFTRALKAEIRDALWMLTRQWQLGEFRGDDAGSPVFAKVQTVTTKLKKYRADGNAAEPFEDNVPLESTVERRPITFRQDRVEMSLDLRLLMGRQWRKLLQSPGIPAGVEAKFLAKYPIRSPDPKQDADVSICAHVESWSAFAGAARRCMDGGKLHEHLIGPPANVASDGISGLTATQRAAIDLLGEKFVKWFARLFHQPAGSDAWNPTRLEYQFSCAAPEKEGEKVLTADEYYQGHLDWYNFEIDRGSDATLGTDTPAPPADEPQTLLPTPLTFEGMPNTRWWSFEDRRTNFGDVKPDTTDIAKLLLIEFGLIYANDWFMIPYTMPAGSIARIRGLAVRNVFGERTWIEAAGGGSDEDWQRWAMFVLNIKGKEDIPADTSLVLLPTVAKVQEGAPVEEVLLTRDEVANMVWGVEKTVPLPGGGTKRGCEAALETLALRRRQTAATASPPPANAKIRYRVTTSVPEEWIPFIPVHVPGNNREIQLQRAALPRILEGDPNPPQKVRPRTTLLREGLDQSPAKAYFIHEEEVPRAGARVVQTFQRTRWRDGRVWIWLSARKQTGRGEASSGLAFDRIEDVKTTP